MEAVADINEFAFVKELPAAKIGAKQENLIGQWRNFKALMQDDPLLPLNFTAKLIGVCNQRVRDLVSEGALKSVDFDGHNYVTESSVLAYMKRERKAGRPRKVPTDRELAKAAYQVGLGKD